MKAAILRYLGYPADAPADPTTLHYIEHAIQEVAHYADFRYLYAHFNKPLPFLTRHATYTDYLYTGEHNHYTDSDVEYLLCAATLGVQIDRQIQRLQLRDLAYATIFDAAANTYLEFHADQFEKRLPYAARGFRFCPGYGDTPLTDNQQIAHYIHAEQIGISFLDSGLMIPLKSMMGIIKIGDTAVKNCNHCKVQSNCEFQKRGTRCYTI